MLKRVKGELKLEISFLHASDMPKTEQNAGKYQACAVFVTSNFIYLRIKSSI
jgi:hypothetical protein